MGSIGGALWMPKHRVALLDDAFGKERSVRVPFKLDGIAVRALTKRLTELFAVSRDAARLRRLKLGQLAG